MDLEIKKNLTSNWFKTLQDAICDDILKIEKTRRNSNLQNGKGIFKKMKVEVSIEYCRMEKYLKKLV